MKTTTKVWLGASALLALVLALIGYRIKTAEPSYQGKSLSEWVNMTELLGEGDPRPKLRSPTNEIGNALRAMCPNAIPFLIAWMDPVPTKAHKWLWAFERTQKLIKLKPGLEPTKRSHYVCIAFEALGQVAEPAIPQLTTLMFDTNASGCYAEALAGLGPKSKPIMLQALCHTNGIIRERAASAIARYEEEPVFAMPFLISLLQDKDARVRSASVAALWHIKSQPKIIVPALIGALSDPDRLVYMDAVWVLGEMGTNAITALPAMQQLLTQTYLSEYEKKRLEFEIRRVTRLHPRPRP
ncbi:MAG: HEAT repeat domain-containing protein [Verrucomicrobiota bacterium]